MPAAVKLPVVSGRRGNDRHPYSLNQGRWVRGGERGNFQSRKGEKLAFLRGLPKPLSGKGTRMPGSIPHHRSSGRLVMLISTPCAQRPARLSPGRRAGSAGCVRHPSRSPAAAAPDSPSPGPRRRQGLCAPPPTATAGAPAAHQMAILLLG